MLWAPIGAANHPARKDRKREVTDLKRRDYVVAERGLGNVAGSEYSLPLLSIEDNLDMVVWEVTPVASRLFNRINCQASLFEHLRQIVVQKVNPATIQH